jgi:hypothetical protein
VASALLLASFGFAFSRERRREVNFIDRTQANDATTSVFKLFSLFSIRRAESAPSDAGRIESAFRIVPPADVRGETARFCRTPRAGLIFVGGRYITEDRIDNGPCRFHGVLSHK